MELPHFELSEWIRKYLPSIKYNLAESGIEPPNLAEAGIDLDVRKFYRNYSERTVGLEETLAETFGVEPENVLVTSSSSEAIYLIHQTLLKQTDEVIVPIPNYPAQLKVPQVVGARPKFLELSFEDGWKLHTDQVEQLTGPKTRLISITNSHNPSGVQLSKQTLVALLEVAKDADAWLLSDEVFREFGFERAPPPAATLGERGISLGTMSKFYGVGDIRIGWVLADPGIVRRLRQLKTWITSVNSHFSEYVAKQVLENHKWFVERARRFQEQNFELVRRFMRSCRSLKWVEPEASLFCFPKILSGEQSVEFCRRIVEQTGVLLDPGVYFDKEGYFRLCFTMNAQTVGNGLDALQGALNSNADTN